MVGLRSFGISAVLGLGLSISLPATAHATCTYDCTGSLVDSECSEAPSDEGVFEWSGDGPFYLLLQCSERCCGGDDPSCSTREDVQPDTSTFQLFDASDRMYVPDVDWTHEASCGGTLVSGDAALKPDHRYEVQIDTTPTVVFDAVEQSGCSVGARSTGLGQLLFVLGLAGWVSRRRKTR
jgi:hypothetical protein